MKSTDEGKKEYLAECYVKLDPWYVYVRWKNDWMKVIKLGFSGGISIFFIRRPEESLAVLESLDTWNSTKTYALTRTVRESKGISSKQKLELLDRAIMYARTIPEPNERVEVLSPIALACSSWAKWTRRRRLLTN